MGLIWNLNLCYFCFAWTYFAILLAEYELMTCGTWNFMKESEIEKVVRRHWACFLHGPILQFCWLSTNWWHVEHEILWKKVRLKKLLEDIELVVSLFWYMFYFPFLLVLFLLVLVNIGSYIFIKHVQNWTSNKLEILFKWGEEFNKYVLIK